MLHISDDTEQFGSQDVCVGFLFENYLQKMKRMVRSGNNVLVQVVKTIHELETTLLTTDLTRLKTTIQAHKPNNAFLLED